MCSPVKLTLLYFLQNYENSTWTKEQKHELSRAAELLQRAKTKQQAPFQVPFRFNKAFWNDGEINIVQNSVFRHDIYSIAVVMVMLTTLRTHHADLSPKYRVLAWNSRWRSLIGLTQSDLMTSLSHDTADWFSPVSVANELSAQHSNIWLVLVVADRSVLQKTLHLPQLHLYRSATRWYMYAIGGLFHVCYICSSSISYMLTAACCGHIGSSTSRYLFCHSSSIADLFRQNQIH